MSPPSSIRCRPRNEAMYGWMYGPDGVLRSRSPYFPSFLPSFTTPSFYPYSEPGYSREGQAALGGHVGREGEAAQGGWGSREGEAALGG